jgi:hypothetical protein
MQPLSGHEAAPCSGGAAPVEANMSRLGDWWGNYLDEREYRAQLRDWKGNSTAFFDTFFGEGQRFDPDNPLCRQLGMTQADYDRWVALRAKHPA